MSDERMVTNSCTHTDDGSVCAACLGLEADDVRVVWCKECGNYPVEREGQLCELCRLGVTAELAALRQQLAVAREALEFYAKRKHYHDSTDPTHEDYLMSKIESDKGDRARRALQAMKKSE